MSGVRMTTDVAVSVMPGAGYRHGLACRNRRRGKVLGEILDATIATVGKGGNERDNYSVRKVQRNETSQEKSPHTIDIEGCFCGCGGRI